MVSHYYVLYVRLIILSLPHSPLLLISMDSHLLLCIIFRDRYIDNKFLFEIPAASLAEDYMGM